MAFRYLLFNKPYNVLSQFTGGSAHAGFEEDAHNGLGIKRTARRDSEFFDCLAAPGRALCAPKTLSDFIPVPDVYAAGRLDLDSEGLLLLTDDGAFQHRVADPRYGHPRTYWAQVEGLITAEALAQMERGLLIQDYRTKPAKAGKMEEPDLAARIPPIRYRKSIPTSWLELTLTEGRNRQVRRMTAAVGFPTLRLIRAAIGSLTLNGLAPGEWRDLSRSEIQACLAKTVASTKAQR